jgi:hypothetical protein
MPGFLHNHIGKLFLIINALDKSDCQVGFEYTGSHMTAQDLFRDSRGTS